MTIVALIFLGLQLAIAVGALVGLIDAARRPSAAFIAAGKLTKPAWVAILAVSAVVAYFFGLNGFLLGLVAAVATIVYFVDVRPAVNAATRGGPYGGP